MYKVERLTATDYDELLTFLNEAFDKTEDKGFDKFLPVMWARDDEHMGKHLAVKDNGKIVAALGIYPLKANIMGEELLFATCGNIGTHKAYRGKGLMSLMLDAAMEEMERMGVDAARLGGQRQRYERYGFEPAGLKRSFKLDRKNITEQPAEITFTPILPTDREAFEFAKSLQTNEPQYVDRGSLEDFYKISSAWFNKPYIATDKTGKMVGMLSVSADKRDIAEVYGLLDSVKYDIIKAWVLNNNLESVGYSGLGYDSGLTRLLSRDCSAVFVQPASQFKIMNWGSTANACLKLKYRESTPPKGEFSVKIHAVGTLLYRDGEFTMTDSDIADIELDVLTATRLLFGFDNPLNVCEIPEAKLNLVNSLLPMPISWNGQDRV